MAFPASLVVFFIFPSSILLSNISYYAVLSWSKGHILTSNKLSHQLPINWNASWDQKPDQQTKSSKSCYFSLVISYRAQSLPGIQWSVCFLLRYRTCVLEVYWRYTGDMLEFYWGYTRGIHEVYLRYTGSILELYLMYTGGLLEVYWRYTRGLLEVS